MEVPPEDDQTQGGKRYRRHEFLWYQTSQYEVEIDADQPVAERQPPTAWFRRLQRQLLKRLLRRQRQR